MSFTLAETIVAASRVGTRSQARPKFGLGLIPHQHGPVDVTMHEWVMLPHRVKTWGGTWHALGVTIQGWLLAEVICPDSRCKVVCTE